METNRTPARRVIAYWFSEKAEAEALTGFAEAALALSPEVALRAGEALVLETRGEAGVGGRLHELALRFGLSGSWAEAESASWAIALAKFGEKREVLPLEAVYYLADPFRLKKEKELRFLDGFIEALSLLGLKRTVELRRLSPDSLSSRFGSLALELYRMIFESEDPPWPLFFPQEKVIEFLEIPCVDLESVSFVLKGLLDRALARLQGRLLRLASLRLTLTLERSSAVKLTERNWDIIFPVPQSTVSGALSILRDRMDFFFSQGPLEGLVQNVRIEVLESVPGSGAQRDFFQKKEEEREAEESLVGRLVQRLGRKKIFSAVLEEKHCPEKAVSKKFSHEVSATKKRGKPTLVERPSRLLFRPELLRNIGPYLVNASGHRWSVRQWQGPERLSGEWWGGTKGGFDRDYYRVMTDEGRLLWVFRDRCSGQVNFYLQGYFD